MCVTIEKTKAEERVDWRGGRIDERKMEKRKEGRNVDDKEASIAATHFTTEGQRTGRQPRRACVLNVPQWRCARSLHQMACYKREPRQLCRNIRRFLWVLVKMKEGRKG
jgi:hypothetical protein